MKRFIFYSAVIGIVFFCSCQDQPEAKSASSFYRDFNLEIVVKKMNVPELRQSESSGSSGQSNDATTGYRRNSSLVYEINDQDGKKFDEEKFFSDLKSEIAKKIGETDIRNISTGSNDRNFYFSYTDDRNKGWMEVVGARVEGNRYRLWCLMREEAGPNVD